MKGVYMAYVGSYSYTGNAKGITVYDVDVENGRFKERCEIDIRIQTDTCPPAPRTADIPSCPGYWPYSAPRFHGINLR